jgi:hypothetical protein
MKTPSSLFGAGVLVWLVAVLVLFFIGLATQTEASPEVALMWALQYWYIGFALGAVMICASGLKKIPVMSLALSAYVLPVVALGAVVILCLSIYPDPGLRESLLGYLPVVVIFYAAGWVWSVIRKNATGVWARMAIPPVLGGGMLILLVAIPAFTSNAFVYRDAFTLHLKELHKGDDKISVKCVLVVNKPGAYIFAAPPSHIFDLVGYHGAEPSDEPPPPGVIIWAAGGPPVTTGTGTHDLVMEWPVSFDSTAFYSDEMMEYFPVYLEVRDGRKDSADLLITVPAVSNEG